MIWDLYWYISFISPKHNISWSHCTCDWRVILGVDTWKHGYSPSEMLCCRKHGVIWCYAVRSKPSIFTTVNWQSRWLWSVYECKIAHALPILSQWKVERLLRKHPISVMTLWCQLMNHNLFKKKKLKKKATVEIKGLCPTATIHKLATIINKILDTLTISDIRDTCM